MNESTEQERNYIIPGGTSNRWWLSLDSNEGYWRVKCPACGKVHERLVHKHWDKEKGHPVESHQFVCFETKTTFFIAEYYPYPVLRETKFGLTKEGGAGKDIPDDAIPF